QVCMAGRPRAVVKIYTADAYERARNNVRLLQSKPTLRLPHLIGHSDRRHAMAFQWMAGTALERLICEEENRIALTKVGEALAELHAQPIQGLPTISPPEMIEESIAAANAI